MDAETMDTTDTATIRSSAGAALGLRQAITASGDDAVTFLQGQLSQDVASMAPGDSRWSLLLQPQGKISAWLRVTRTGGDSFLLDVDAGWADTVVARLTRFRLRTKCDLEILPWTSLTIVGAGAFDATIEGAETEVHDSWAGLPVVIAFGDAPTANVPEVSAELMATLRVEAGRPAMGPELDESTIPAAAGIVNQSVSFTKGCYTGQELVARIDSRGNNVPRRLVGLVIDGAAVQAGAVISNEDKDISTVTTAGQSSVLDGAVAMAYMPRSVEDGATVTVSGQSAIVHPLPLVTA